MVRNQLQAQWWKKKERKKKKKNLVPSELKISSSIIINHVLRVVCRCHSNSYSNSSNSSSGYAPANMLHLHVSCHGPTSPRSYVMRLLANLIAKFDTSQSRRYRVTISSSLCYLGNDRVLMNNPILNPLHLEGTSYFNLANSSDFHFFYHLLIIVTSVYICTMRCMIVLWLA